MKPVDDPRPACAPVAPLPDRAEPQVAVRPAIARIKVQGLECEQCVTRIRNALRQLPHVLGAEVSLRARAVEVLYDSARASLSGLAQSVAASAEGTPRAYAVSRPKVLWTWSAKRS